MDAEQFCAELEEIMAEDGWAQTIDFGDTSPVIMRKLMSYITWLRSERRDDPMFDCFSARKS